MRSWVVLPWTMHVYSNCWPIQLCLGVGSEAVGVETPGDFLDLYVSSLKRKMTMEN